MNPEATHTTTVKGHPRRWWTLSILLVILSVALVGLAISAPTSPTERRPPHTATIDRAPAQASARPDPARPNPVLRPDPPTRLTIPAIGVDTKLLRLGLNKDRSVQVPGPDDADKAGWYRLGTEPGRQGAAVILGHVDSLTGPAVFYRLKTLTTGSRFTVTRSDRSVATFKVLRVATYANSKFPARQLYAPATKRSLLNLVTCGGDYDRARGGYQSNVVAYSQLVMIKSPPAQQHPGGGSGEVPG